MDDFLFVRSANILNICNVPSPAATASLSIGQAVAHMADQEFGLKEQKTAPIAMPLSKP